jgi:hypothetical protein
MTRMADLRLGHFAIDLIIVCDVQIRTRDTVSIESQNLIFDFLHVSVVARNSRFRQKIVVINAHEIAKTTVAVTLALVITNLS